MLKKALIAGLIIIIIVVVILPFVFSFQLDKYQSAYVARLSSGHWLHVKKHQFSRGWFNSHSHITLVPDSALCSHDCPTIHVDSTIYHGPIPFEAFANSDVSTQLALGVVISKVSIDTPAAQFTPDLPTLNVTDIIHLGGDQDATLEMPGSRHRVTTPEGNYRLNLSAVHGKARLNADSEIQHGELKTPGFILKNAADHAIVAQASHAELKLGRSPRGELQLTQSLDKLRVHTGGGPAFNLKKLHIDSRTHGQKNLTGGSLNLRFQKLYAGAHTYGPARMRLHAEHINVPALRRLDAGISRLAGNHLPPALTLVGAMALYHDSMGALLRPGPEIDIRQADLQTDKGRLSGSLHISVPGHKQAGAGSLVGVIDSLAVSGHARIPAPIMRALMRRRIAFEQDHPPSTDQVKQALENLVSRGVLNPAKNGEAFEMQARLSQGHLTINGRPSTAWKKLHGLLEKISGGSDILRQLLTPQKQPPQQKGQLRQPQH